MSWFTGSEKRHIAVDEAEICVRTWGNRHQPALVLLHGFPQSHVMWHRAAQVLQHDYFLVMPDLRGYGDSSKPTAHTQDAQAQNNQAQHTPAPHAQASKRALAQDIVSVMDTLGVDQFYLCGHDRGGRVAHRLALDHPARVRKLCVIDIAPTLDMYNATDMAFASAYYHWFHLIQRYPLPETMLHAAWKEYLHAKLGGWGSAGLGYIEAQALAEYERHFSKIETIHAMCEDYRASAGIDLLHDQHSRSQGEKIACELLVLWGERGVVHRMFRPLPLWQAQCAGQVQGQALPAGHFIPEELPGATADALTAFFTGSIGP